MGSKPLRMERENWGASAAPGRTGKGRVALAAMGCIWVKLALLPKCLRALKGDSVSPSCPEVTASGAKDSPALGKLEGLLQAGLESRVPMVGITLASGRKHACGSTNRSPICVLIRRKNRYEKFLFGI